MRELTEEWLRNVNEELRKNDIPPRQRPWAAWSEWAKHAGVPIASDDEATKTIFAWFEKNTKAGSQHMGSLYAGTYYYDSCFWPVIIEICYGTVKLDAREALKSMPESIAAGLFANQTKALDYVSVWADCVDYAFGLDDLKKTGGFGRFTQELLNGGDQEMRATVALLLQNKPSPKAPESARMCTEMFLKAFLAAKAGLTEDEAKYKIGHDLEKGLNRCLAFDAESELRDIRPHLNAFPDIGDRYKGSDKSPKELWRAYAIAQCVGSTVARTLSGRDIRKTINVNNF
jgi:hypothetical protein